MGRKKRTESRVQPKQTVSRQETASVLSFNVDAVASLRSSKNNSERKFCDETESFSKGIRGTKAVGALRSSGANEPVAIRADLTEDQNNNKMRRRKIKP